jgi:predicted amino acid dehydrogenase
LNSFAFIIHPIDPKKDVSRKFPFLGKILTRNQIDFFSTFFPPIYISEITGIKSPATGVEIKGWFIACPYTPTRMNQLPERTVYNKIVQTGRMAERLGADVLGLGAHTSVIGDGGLTIASQLEIPVTTGDSLTIALAVEAIEEAAHQMDIPLPETTAAIVGATGAIGRLCAEKLTGRVQTLVLVARREDALDQLAKKLQSKNTGTEIIATTNIDKIKDAKLILTVSSAITTIINPEHLQPGAVVCDVARPRDISKKVAASRDDILVIDGGMVDIPGNVNFNFDFGFPAGKAYACMAETMLLAMEGIFTDYTVGKNIAIEKVNEISALAQKHSFTLSGFRSFEREITPEQIAKIRQNARINRNSYKV